MGGLVFVALNVKRLSLRSGSHVLPRRQALGRQKCVFLGHGLGLDWIGLWRTEVAHGPDLLGLRLDLSAPPVTVLFAQQL